LRLARAICGANAADMQKWALVRSAMIGAMVYAIACADSDSDASPTCESTGTRPGVGNFTISRLIEEVRAEPFGLIEVAEACSGNDSDRVGTDRCGCDGLTCAPGETCVLSDAPTEGRPTQINQCHVICAADSDCAPGEVCLPPVGNSDVPVCRKAGCQSSDECCSGRCLVWTYYESQGTPNTIWGIQCE
jgi:hypothetical protein